MGDVKHMVCVETPDSKSRRWNKLPVRTPNSPSATIVPGNESVTSDDVAIGMSDSLEVLLLNVDPESASCEQGLEAKACTECGHQEPNLQLWE